MWRTVDENDLAATVSQREIDVFRQDAGLDGGDAVARLLERTAAKARMYLASNAAVRPGPYPSVPPSLVGAVCDLAAYDILKRLPLEVGADRKAARDAALDLLEKIANGAVTPESDGAGDAEAGKATVPRFADVRPTRRLDTLSAALAVFFGGSFLLPPWVLTAGAAPLSLDWRVDAAETRAQAFTAYRGETLRFNPRITDHGQDITNLAYECCYYQTNGMQNAWWRTDGLVFAPSNDCGAASYRFFVAAHAPEGRVYRANGLLRFLDSPGTVPNKLPLPAESLDFAQVAWTNAPWATEEEVRSLELGVRSLGDEVVAATNAALANAAAYTDAATNAVLEAANDTAGHLYQRAEGLVQDLGLHLTPRVDAMEERLALTPDASDLASVAFTGSWEQLTDKPAIASPADLAAATNATLAAANAALEAEVDLWFRNTNAWFSVSNGVLRVYEIDGGTNALVRYLSDPSAMSNALASLARTLGQATNELREAVGAAPAQWARYAADGSENLLSNAVNLAGRPLVFSADGLTWTGTNGFYVMTAHALPGAATGDAGQFRIGPDADDWFGLEITASYLVDAKATGFRHAGTVSTIVTAYDATYPAVPPRVYYSASLAEPFAEVTEGLSWAHDAAAGDSTATLTGQTGAAGFYFLKKEEQGGAVFRSTMPVFAEGYRVERDGAYVGTFQPNAIIEVIEIGGALFRVMAEEVK